MIRTSDTHPLQIDTLTIPGRPGRIGLTFCPGKKQDHAITGAWCRDLDEDLDAILNWGASLLVTLTEQHELDDLAVGDLGIRAARSGLGWVHLPIVDLDIPEQELYVHKLGS
jgi:ADP-ribosyl-[dinitrogen reductase] hydrolase